MTESPLFPGFVPRLVDVGDGVHIQALIGGRGRPLLLLQLLLFSGAAAFLTARVLLGVMDVSELGLLRAVARGLILIGAGLAGANLLAMLLLLWRRSRGAAPVSDHRA